MEDLNHEKIWHAVHQCSACGVHDGFCSPGECICPWGGTATDPESSISTQAAVTGTVLKGGETIRNGGEYILRGDYTQQIIIESTEPVTINIDGNVNYTVTGDWYYTKGLLYVKKVPELTINGTGATVTGQGRAFLYSDNRDDSLPEWKINVVGGTYTTQGDTFDFSAGNASYTTKVSMEQVTATGYRAVAIDYCDVEIANSDFYGTETDLEDYENSGAITVFNAKVTLNNVTATAVGENSDLASIGIEGGTVTVNGGTYYSWINNSHYGTNGKITLNNVTTQGGIFNEEELTINGGTHTSDGCVVYTYFDGYSSHSSKTWIHGGTFISSNTKNGSDNFTIGIDNGECYIDETYSTTKIQNAASDSAAIYRKGGSVEINAGTVIAPNGSAIKTSRGCVTVNGGELRGKYGLYDEDGTYDDSNQPKINGGTISGTVADIYLGKETYYDSTVLIGRDYDQELTVLVENPSNGRKITVETPDADDDESSYVPYQQNLKLVSLNPGYTIGIGEQRYWDDQSSEYRCLVAQNTVTAQNATAKADLGEGEKTLTTSDLVECGKPVTITANAPAATAPDADSPDTVFANWKTDNDLTINGEATGSKVNGSAEHELTFTMPSEPVSVTAVDQYKITIKGGKKYDDTAENEDGTYYYYAKAGDTVQLAFSGENGSHWSWNTAELPDGVIDAADDDPAHFTMPANAVTIEASAESKPVIPRAYRVQVQLPADVAFAEDAAPVTVSVPDTTGTDEDPKPDRTSTTALGAEPEQLVTLKFDAATLPEGYTFGQWVVTQLLPEQTTVEVTAGSDLEATFSMPASPVTVTFTVNAPVEPEPDPEPADDGGTGAVIAGALIGGTAYLLGTRAWLEGTYGYVPANRMELALGLWKRANCPAPVSTELYADIQQNDADAQAAARWCVEQGLLKDYHEQNDDGTETVTFKPGRYVARPYALTRWYQLEKLLDEQQAAQAETPAEAPAQISET